MHDTAVLNAKKFIKEFVRPGMRIVDIGSFDINGSLRAHMPDGCRYEGYDLEPGPGVDYVLDNSYDIPLLEGTVDVALSNSAFEHIEFFWLTFLEMCRITKPGGMIYICAPSQGPFHPVPVDCWRFYPDSAKALANWARYNDYPLSVVKTYISIFRNPEIPDVPDPWQDWVAVFQRGPK